MHPSDARMSDWGPITYNVDSSSVSDFPMAIFAAVNSPVTIEFDLTSDQIGAATLRIGTTLSFAGARPQATVSAPSIVCPSPPSPALHNESYGLPITSASR